MLFCFDWGAGIAGAAWLWGIVPLHVHNQSIIHSFTHMGAEQVLQEEGADLSGRGGEQPGGPRGTQNTYNICIHVHILYTSNCPPRAPPLIPRINHNYNNNNNPKKQECLEEQAAGKSARVIRRVHLDDADAALEEEVSVRRRGRGRRPSSPAGSRPAAEGDDGITPPAADAATGGGGGKFDWDELQTHYPYVLDCPQDPDVHHIVLRGLYAFPYEYFLRFFPREALHVVTQEELKVRVFSHVCSRVFGVASGRREIGDMADHTQVYMTPYTHQHDTYTPPQKTRRTSKRRWRGWWTFWACARTTSAGTTSSPSTSRVRERGAAL